MALGQIWHRATSWGLDLLFPPTCVGCGRRGSFLCPPCQEALPRLEPPYCHRCGVPLTPTCRGHPDGIGTAAFGGSGSLCPRCQESPLEIDGLRSPYLMEGAIRQAVHRLKYDNLRALAPVLAGLLAGYLEAHPIPAEVLVPVPLHPRRERQRGYNQAALLAREMGKQAGLPVVSGCLRRLRDSPPQARAASAADRLRQVEGAFAGVGLEGRWVLLLDDVSTTGATLDACARALKGAGAASVWGLTLAREPRATF